MKNEEMMKSGSVWKAIASMAIPSAVIMILMIFYYLVVRIPLAYVFSYIGLGLNGIWIAVLISHIIACITAILTGTHSFKKNIKMENIYLLQLHRQWKDAKR